MISNQKDSENVAAHHFARPSISQIPGLGDLTFPMVASEHKQQNERFRELNVTLLVQAGIC